jgi:hypothetical protein
MIGSKEEIVRRAMYERYSSFTEHGEFEIVARVCHSDPCPLAGLEIESFTF